MRIPAPLLLLATLLAITALPVQAADAEVPVDEAPADQVTADATATDAATVASDVSTAADEDATPGTLAADDTFVPTVEISEDLSVSFPADI